MRRKRSSIALLLFSLSSLTALADPTENSAKKPKVDIFAAQWAGSAQTDARHDGDSFLRFVGDGALVSDEPLTYQIIPGEPGRLRLKLSQEAVAKINQAYRANPEQKLAFVHKGKILFAPAPKAAIESDELELTFGDVSSFRELVDSLAEISSAN